MHHFPELQQTPGTSNLRKAEFLLAYNYRTQSIKAGEHGGSTDKQLAHRILSLKQMDAPTQPALSFLTLSVTSAHAMLCYL